MNEQSGIDHVLDVKRANRFWLAGGLAALLSCVSWINPMLVRLINLRIFHVDAASSSGWWLYVSMRIVVAFWLVYTIWRMPRPVAQAGGPTRVKVKRADRERFFDPLMGLRAFACFLVVMGHYFLVVMPFSPAGVWHGAGPLLESSPWAGVWIFFTLSGFLMGKGFSSGRYSLDEAGMRAFLRNRWLRIAPIYFSSVLVISAFRYPALFEWKNWWMLLEMCLFDFRGDLPIAGVNVLWSVSTEMQFYLLVPLLMFGLLQLRRRLGDAFPIVPIMALVLGASFKTLLVKHTGNMFAYGYSPLLPNLDLFVCGLSLSLLPDLKRKSQAAKRLAGSLLFAGTAIFYLILCLLTPHGSSLQPQLSLYWARDPWIAAVFAAVFIYLAEPMGKVKLEANALGRLLGAVQWMGTLTYCIYVFHSDVFLELAELVPKVHVLRVSLVQFPTAILETVGVAALFYFLVEKPFELRKKLPGTALIDAP